MDRSKDKVIQFSIRLPKSLIMLLDKEAKEVVRSRQNLIELILTEWAKSKGKKS